MPISVRGSGGTSMIGAKASGLFFPVELPPSVYYSQAAQWVTLNSNQLPSSSAASKCICVNGALYILFGSKIYTANLQNGVISDPGFPSIHGNTPRNSSSICTDGKRFIWAIPHNATYLYEIDVIAKSVTLLSSVFPTSLYTMVGALVYSPKQNTVYMCGELTFNTSAGGVSRIVAYNRNTNSIESRVAIASSYNIAASYAIADDVNNNIYFGGISNFNQLYKAGAVYKHSIAANTLSNSGTTPSAISDLSMWSSVLMGDTMISFAGSQVCCFNPKTGASIAGQLPGPSNTPYRDQVGVWNNTLYTYVHGVGVRKCVFYENLPADAPVVCKIYKGQKYHSTEPFEIPNKLSVTRQQKTATQDIEIKMYEYSAEGGQVIYIET